ncbi:MAG: helix-turn-helix domain-containing protein [Bacteroides sp.]|nr:helix-turn-helix domain-containing protein [Bacteroides sp.]
MKYYGRIRDLREDADLTQEQLIKRLGMHKTTYTNYEQGKHTVPLDFAVALADFYGVSLDYLAGRTNRKDLVPVPLVPEEEELLSIFRALGEREKGRLIGYADALRG